MTEETKSTRRPFLFLVAGLAAIGILGLLFAYFGSGWRPYNTAAQQTVSDPTASLDLPEEVRQLRADALSVASQVAEDLPAIPDAFFVKGLVHSRYGHRDVAVSCWEGCLDINPRFANAYFCLGRNALDLAEYDESSKLLRKSLQLDPEISTAHLLLGTAMMRLGRVEEAIASLKIYIQSVPQSAQGFFRLGQAYLHLEQYQTAKQYHRAALEIAPEFTNAYYGLATACRLLGEEEQARQHLQKFTELKAQDQQAETRRLQESDDLAALRSSVADAYRETGRVYAGQGMDERAERCWLTAVTLDPRDAESRKALISLYEPVGRTTETLSLLRQLREIEPDNPVHLINFGVIKLRLQQNEEAAEAFVELTELWPERPDGYSALVQLYLQTDTKLDEATKLAATLVRLEAIARNYFLLGATRNRTGDREGALAAMARAVELDPGNPQYQQAYEDVQKKK